MSLEGKGFYIWKIHRCEGGDTQAIVQRAKDAGLTHILIKIADGSNAYNVDLATPLVEALKNAGIQAWGWQFVYGREPFEEAGIAAHRVKVLALDGFVVNAETDYKGKNAAASAYMGELRRALPDATIGLSSFRYPRYHPTMPWTEFLSQCDLNLPQVYWLKNDNPAEQIDNSISQFQSIYPLRPVIPTGAAYEEFGWRPEPAHLEEFLTHARNTGLPAANFWSWDYAGSDAGRDLWNTIARFDWPISHPAPDLAELLVDALNRRDIDAVLGLYQPNAVLVTSKETLQGLPAIRDYYLKLWDALPHAAFVIETRVTQDNIRHVKWDARGSTSGLSVDDGQDTIGSRQGRIQYHSSIYRLQ